MSYHIVLRLPWRLTLRSAWTLQTLRMQLFISARERHNHRVVSNRQIIWQALLASGYRSSQNLNQIEASSDGSITGSGATFSTREFVLGISSPEVPNCYNTPPLRRRDPICGRRRKSTNTTHANPGVKLRKRLE